MGVVKSLNRAIAKIFIGLINLLYVKSVARFIPSHTFRYLACGVGNYFVLDTLLYYLIYHYIVGERYYDLWVVVISPHVMAMVVVFPITFFTGFWLNRYVAFESTAQRARVQVAKYAISILGSIIISYIALKFLVEVCGVWATPSKGLASVITAIYSYLAARYFTFKKG
ncbi:MAG: GtrA family protein [Rikenellaceae bacterium]